MTELTIAEDSYGYFSNKLSYLSNRKMLLVVIKSALRCFLRLLLELTSMFYSTVTHVLYTSNKFHTTASYTVCSK